MGVYFMNQILQTSPKAISKKQLLKLQFIISVFLLIIILVIWGSIKYINNIAEESSKKIINNYNISRLYNKGNSLYYTNDKIIGILDIPSINITYPIFANYSDELLKISPCKFYGDINNNLCIAGHNYDNNKFFSKIYTLKNYDIVNFYDNNNIHYEYRVFANYEVKTSDTSPIYDETSSQELTLITCNNFNDKRIIIKAKL